MRWSLPTALCQGRQALAKRKERQAYFDQQIELEMKQRRLWQAPTYHNLGMVAQEERKWLEAEGYYQQALQIKVEYNDRYSQASTYHQLGVVAQEERKWEESRELFLQSLSIFREYDDTHNSSIALNSLARLWQASNDASIPERVASILTISQEEVEKLLQERLKDG